MDILLSDLSEVQSSIVKDLIIPSYQNEITQGLKDRILWDKLSTFFYTVSIILNSFSGICAFAAGFASFQEKSQILTFVSGTLCSLGIALSIFSKHCEGQSKESTKKVNTLLKSLGINLQIPDIPSDIIESNSRQKMQSFTTKMNLP